MSEKKTRERDRVAAKTEPVNDNDRPPDFRLCGQEVRAAVWRDLLFPYPFSDNNQIVTLQGGMRSCRVVVPGRRRDGRH